MKTSYGAYAISLAVNVAALAAVALRQPEASIAKSTPTALAFSAITSRPLHAPPKPTEPKHRPMAIEFVVLTPPMARPTPATAIAVPSPIRASAAPAARAIAASPQPATPPTEAPTDSPSSWSPIATALPTTTGRLDLGLGARVLSQQMAGVASSAIGAPLERDPNAWAKSIGPLSIGPRERTAAYGSKGAGERSIGEVTVTTSRDGRIAMRNEPPVNVKCCIFWVEVEEGVRLPMPGIFGKIDTTEMLAALAGYDLYYAKKLAYADDTREARVAMRKAYTKEVAASSTKLVRSYVRALWDDPTNSFAQKRRDLCLLWREATPSTDIDDPDLRAAAADAQRAITRFILDTLPVGSANAYAPDELRELNKSVPANLQCWPYGRSYGS